MPTGTPARRRTRRRAPVLGDARASSGSSKGQWGRSPLRGPPRDTVQRPGPCRKSPALLCVMRALPNSSTGGNAYTLSVHKRTHRYVHTDPMSKRVTDIHANVCTRTRGHTHTHNRGYRKTLLSLGHHWVSRAGRQRGHLCPAEGLVAHTWSVMLLVGTSERTFSSVQARTLQSGAFWRS